jgi:hypothetical protein
VDPEQLDKEITEEAHRQAHQVVVELAAAAQEQWDKMVKQAVKLEMAVLDPLHIRRGD